MLEQDLCQMKGDKIQPPKRLRDIFFLYPRISAVPIIKPNKWRIEFLLIKKHQALDIAHRFLKLREAGEQIDACT